MEDGGGVAAARAVLDRAAAHVRPAVVTRDLVVNWWNDAAAVLGEPYAGRLEAMTLADFPAPVSRIDSASFYLVRGLHALHTGHRATGVAYCDSVTALLAEWDRDADRPPQRAGDPATAPLAFLTAAHACGKPADASPPQRRGAACGARPPARRVGAFRGPVRARDRGRAAREPGFRRRPPGASGPDAVERVGELAASGSGVRLAPRRPAVRGASRTPATLTSWQPHPRRANLPSRRFRTVSSVPSR
jgi:hypothetical protein